MSRDPYRSGSIVPNEAPPRDYYAQNLRILVQSVVEQYGDLLEEIESNFASSLLTLSSDAIRLLSRVAARKGPIFFIDQMNYEEVNDRDAALSELEKQELVVLNPRLPVDELLSSLTVRQLKSIFEDAAFISPKSSYIESILDSKSVCCVRNELEKNKPWFCLSCAEMLELFLLLFFGNRNSDLSAFVVRDLGIVEYESYPLNKGERQFARRGELNTYLNWISLDRALHENEMNQTVEEARTYIDALEQVQENRTVERFRCRILNNLGQVLERAKSPRLAIKAYRLSRHHPARERIVRILYRLGKRNAAKRLQAKIVDNPWTKEEEFFGARFPSRRKQKEIYSVDNYQIDELPELPIEQYALQILCKEGSIGWHFENALPLTLFGLVYWDWIFASVPGAFTNPFQSAPRDLLWPEFVEVRQRHCENPLAAQESIVERVLETAKSKLGKANRFVRWDLLPQSRLERIAHALGDSTIESLLGIVRSDISQYKSGFPDLTVIHPDGQFEFVEVKGPGDQIQRNQRIWLESLSVAQLPSRVMQFTFPR